MNALLECFKHDFTTYNTLKFNFRALVFKIFPGGGAQDPLN